MPDSSTVASAFPIALVTGGAQRIGRAVVEELARAGWAIAIHYNGSEGAARALVAELRHRGVPAAAFQADLGRPEAPERLMAAVVEGLGAPTALVNCASLFRFDTAETVTLESWDAHLNANLRGPVFLAKAFAASCRGDDPVVVNFLDQKVRNLNPDFFSYTAAKLALEGMTRLLAMTWRGRIRVHGLAPGLTLPSADQTEEEFARAHAAAPLGLGSTPAELARAVRFLLEAKDFRSDLLVVDGGQHLQPRARDVMFELREGMA